MPYMNLCLSTAISTPLLCLATRKLGRTEAIRKWQKVLSPELVVDAIRPLSALATSSPLRENCCLSCTSLHLACKKSVCFHLL